MREMCPQGSQESDTQLMTQQHWTVVADGQETGVFVTDYELVLGLAEEYLSLGAEDVQIVEVNQ